MSGIIDVNTGSIRSHADHVKTMVGRAEMAVDAASQVIFHPQTYGAIGAALVYPFLAPLEAAGAAGTQAVVEALTDTAIGLNAVADTFDFVDNAVEGAMHELKGRL